MEMKKRSMLNDTARLGLEHASFKCQVSVIRAYTVITEYVNFECLTQVLNPDIMA
jgi:hypothetical protein